MQQKAHRWPQSAQLHPEQPGRRAERHRGLDGPPSLSAVSPFTVIRAYRRFLFSQEWIVGDNLLQSYWLTAQKKSRPGKQAFVAAVPQNPAAGFSFSPPVLKHTCWATPSAKKKKRGRGTTYRKGKTALTSATPPNTWPTQLTQKKKASSVCQFLAAGKIKKIICLHRKHQVCRKKLVYCWLICWHVHLKNVTSSTC